MSEHLLNWNVLSSELCSFSLGTLHRSLQDASGVSKLKLEDRRKDIRVCKEGLLLLLFSLIILDLSEYTGLGLVVDPFTDEELVLVVIEVRALTLSHIVDPVALKMVAVSLCENAVAVALALVPLSLVDVLVGVDHATLSLRHAADPVAIIAVPILVEEGATAVLLIFEPITSVFAAQLARLVSPVSSLTVSLVALPETLILVTVLVELDTEAVLLIVLPVADVSG